MKLTTMAAIYFLLWFFSLFMILPFGVRTSEEAGVELVPGQAESAPAHFNVKRTMLRTSLLAAALFALFYLNYVNGWVTAQSLSRLYGLPSK